MNEIGDWTKFGEENLENAIIEDFKARGYEHVKGETIQRDRREVILFDDLQTYLRHRCPDITDGEIRTAAFMFRVSDRGDYVSNRETLQKIREGYSIKRENEETALWINLLDFQHPENNIFKIVNQLDIQGPTIDRRPDAIVYVNGIPLVVLEFKSAIREDATIYDAYEQLNFRYIRDIPELFIYNAFTVISDGVNSKAGTVFMDYPDYYSWNRAEAKDPPCDGIGSLRTLMDGMFRKDRLLAIIRDFIYFPDDSGNNEKILCRYPQFFAATELLDNIRPHMKPKGDGKGGTYFGTTGCGKSFTMLFLTRLIMRSKDMRNPTIILITDREDLDNQLSKQFIRSRRFLGDENVLSMDTGTELRSKLKDVASGGVYLSTIQKFNEEGSMLSDRSNIIIISDEAHRSQLNMEQADKIVDGKRRHTVGFARILHDSFPNATYVGFSGTPIDETMEVFGGIVDEYTMAESEKDRITSKIVYEGRAAKVALAEDQMAAIEEYYKNSLDRGANEYQIEKSKKDLLKLDVIIGNEDRLEKVSDDFIAHYEARVEEGATVAGKAMLVCANRRIAYDFYQILKRKRPGWFEIKEADGPFKEGEEKAEPIEMVKLVATRGSNDPVDLFELCGDSAYRSNLQTQFKKIESNFKIAIVVDMWLTGFDVPFLDAMYLDKPIQKHSLIQAISRVNRIYEGKEYGLIVDYLGIKKELDLALNRYVRGNAGRGGYSDSGEFVKIVKDTLSALDGRFHGFDLSDYFSEDSSKQMTCLGRAMEFVQHDKEFEHWFMGTVRKLKTAYNNCVYSDEITTDERSKIYFYCGVRSMVAKVISGNAPDTAQINCKVREMLEKAIQSDEVSQIGIVIDDIETGRIDLLSDEYLERLESLPGSNTKFKLLERLARLAIRRLGKTNKLKADSFSERFNKIVDKYNDRHMRAEELRQIIDSMTDDIVDLLNSELVSLIREIDKEGEEANALGLTKQEKAFYDILVHIIDLYDFEFDSAKLLDMARDLKTCTDEVCSVLDWSSKQDVKDELRMRIAMVMQKHGFPPIYLSGVYDEVFKQMENYKRYSE